MSERVAGQETTVHVLACVEYVVRLIEHYDVTVQANVEAFPCRPVQDAAVGNQQEIRFVRSLSHPVIPACLVVLRESHGVFDRENLRQYTVRNSDRFVLVTAATLFKM